MGAPLIESSSFHDALFSLGYVHAGDRIEQMIAMRLLAQGRLSEIAGAEALDIDRLMRAANLKQSAAQQYADASPRLKRFFEVYARGVNAYLFRYRDKLPSDLASSGYRPEYWKAEDSALIFSLYAFSQSVNLQEELSALTLAQKVGSDKLAWLLPSAPDEALANGEADKLKGIDLTRIPGTLFRSDPHPWPGRRHCGQPEAHRAGPAGQRRLVQPRAGSAAQPQRQELAGQRQPRRLGLEPGADPH